MPRSFAKGTRFVVRDLKSTNGTFVNGQRIDEHRLTDGDLVVIADVHFSFRTHSEEQVRKTVTQVMDHSGSAAAKREDDAAGDLIHAVRRLHETLLHRATRNRFQPIFDLAENRCVGYEAIPRPQLPGEASAAAANARRHRLPPDRADVASCTG